MKNFNEKAKAYALKNAIAHNGKANSSAIILANIRSPNSPDRKL